MQNHSAKPQTLKTIAKRYCGFEFFVLRFGFFRRDGITLLLVVVLLSAILSISLGIFNVVYGEFRISGEVADSFRALYAADEGIERTLYLDRQGDGVCVVVEGRDCYVVTDIPVLSGGQYSARVSKENGRTAVIVAGQNRAGVHSARIIRRGFQVTY